MKTIIPLDPVTRIEGHLKVEIEVDVVAGVQQVTEARATGTLFRGFETILIGRNPEDAPHITQRICGVCPVPHAVASVEALENAGAATAPDNGRIIRNLVLGANFIDSHILHFYHLAALDFLEGPAMAPWQPSWKADKRFDKATTATLVQHYLTALDMRRKAHEMGAIFGGKLPHTPAIIRGGATAVPKAADITRCRAYLTELNTFVRDIYLPDVEALAATYPEYASIGRGHGNLLAFGVFDLDAAGTSKLLKPGWTFDGNPSVQPIDLTQIREQVEYSWYANTGGNLNPANGVTVPQYPKASAYSWMKAPRYKTLPLEAGALSRMWVNGDYQRGISVLDRHRARVLETQKIIGEMAQWLGQIKLGSPAYTNKALPLNAKGVGLTEAPRGALGHWFEMKNGLISRYQIITPTCWNASPRDGSGMRGPLEQALVGTTVANKAEPIEVLRIIHSFDPCMSCAVHVVDPVDRRFVVPVGVAL
jgi:hydrogenase large subunit